MSVMGLDYGTKTVGVAISDSMLITAQPIETITRKNESKLRRTYARIRELVAEHDVDQIVVGDPKNMDGSPSEMSDKARAFAEELGVKTGLPVMLVDERLTTMEAGEVLSDAGVPEYEQKQHIDKIAAALILRDYLNM